MICQDIDLSNLDTNTPEGFLKLIIEFLSGKEFNIESCKDPSFLKFFSNAQKMGIDYNQFNELMLVLNENIVSQGFFDFFFGKKLLKLDDLKQGVTKFRAFAFLFFGNFRFAYKSLIHLDESEIEARFRSYLRESIAIIKEFADRSQKILEIEKIDRDKTWYLGYVSGKKAERELQAVKRKRNKEYSIFKKFLTQLTCEIESEQKIALANTNIYLTWDRLDLYFATSMRNKWEYEETYDLIENIFKDSRLQQFKLRYFDPTQSTCANSREKGLIEGLMLKRASCTIYLAQESDTMGKDSELAATLTQNKPVIAYVPEHDPIAYAKKIRSYPLNFFKKRLLILLAEDSFEEISDYDKWNKLLVDCDPSFKKTISNFLDELEKYREKQPFELWVEKEEDFKAKSLLFGKVCDILSIVECYSFDRRAELLQLRHPLSMQVDMQTGVANGVLVVRKTTDCIELLYRILTNELQFDIKNDPKGFIILEERISKSPFRVIVKNEKLTNSYWNLFFGH